MKPTLQPGQALVIIGPNGSDKIEVHEKMKPSRMVPTPNFIICTSDPNAFVGAEDRRFKVVRLGAVRETSK